MTRVLLVEDDAAIRANVIRLLELEGYEVLAADNGIAGLERARAMRPDIVVSDIGLPGMDGFALLEAIRADDAFATTGVLLLTALDDRASMRRGMTAGADDYLAKPFTRDELLEALRGLQARRGRIAQTVASAVQEREDRLQRAFTDSLGGRSPPDKFGLEVQEAETDGVIRATVLFSDIRGFTSIAEKLGSAEVAELLTHYFDRVCAPVLEAGGRHLKFIGDGLLAVFEDDGDSACGARRAVAAALSMALVAHEFRSWVDARFAHRALPPLAIGVGLQCGEVALGRIGPAGNREVTPIGDTVNVAARLEAACKELGWTVVASSEVLACAGEGVQTGGMTSLAVRGKSGYVDVAEITGLVTPREATRDAASIAARAQAIRDAVRINSEITARAVKGALQSKLSALRHHAFGPGAEPLQLKGYRLTRRIGAGGMTQVYLAERESDGTQLVLKVLDAGGKPSIERLSRFIQEYALLSGFRHPHVVRILDQGFTDDHAYIAMEYFAQGDLRREMAGVPLARSRAIDILRQIGSALEAIHTRGIVHRDLKPENVMRREDGTVALADFGIAQSFAAVQAVPSGAAQEHEALGTPYYISPEQAMRRSATAQSDLYSLGVLFHEMLSGRRPFRAESLGALLAMHMHAPAPPLPAAHADLQWIADGLLAKAAADRFPSAGALLDSLSRRQGLV